MHSMLHIKTCIPGKYYYEIRNVYHFFRGLFYLGVNCQCPLCRWHSRKYLSSGTESVRNKTVIVGGRRPNAICPRCGSFERQRLLWLYLTEKTDFFSQRLKVLHVAPEYLLQKMIGRLPNIDYMSVDLESPLALEKMDICNTSFDDDSFDVIICFHVLEHVPDDRQAMRELRRLLKKDGWALLQVPINIVDGDTREDARVNTDEEREFHYGQSDHRRLYGYRDYKDRLEEAGFLVETDDFVKQIGRERIDSHGLDERELMYVCRRKD